MIRTLRAGTFSLDELYDLAEDNGLDVRDDGRDVIHGRTDTRWRRRVRNALQAAKREGRARSIGGATWVIEGTAEEPTRALLVLSACELGHVELEVAEAADLLGRLADEGIAADLCLMDPPWALERQSDNPSRRERNDRLYARDRTSVVGGYREVDAGAYRAFSEEWVHAAARLLELRPGGYLAVVTGPQQAARIQVSAEDAGLTYVNQVFVKKPFALRTTRRFAHAHAVVTICCSGKLESPRRFFSAPADLPLAASGNSYPLSWWDDPNWEDEAAPQALGAGSAWDDLKRYDRRNLLRYDNALAPELVRRVISALTPGPENGGVSWESMVIDSFCGSGTTPLVCADIGRRCISADANPKSIAFAAARLLDEGDLEHTAFRQLSLGQPISA